MARRLNLDLLKTEAAGGGALALAAALGMLAANGPWSSAYFRTLAAPLTATLGPWSQTLSAVEWIKEGLMTLFFFVVGLEIKLEVVKGELSSARRLALPVIAAAGGMAGPALIYLAVAAVMGGGEAQRGWPVPTATDIAFALAALSLAARRAPPALRTFLLALAVVDDLGAVVLIAVLFTHGLKLKLLGWALALVAGLAALGRWRAAPTALFVAGGLALWALTLRAGVSPSIAGVAAALCVPLRPRRAGERGVLERAMDGVEPWVTWGVLPLFAFAVAGVRLSDLSWRETLGAAPVGIVLALALGKPLGVLAASVLAVRLKIARRPVGVGWSDIGAAALLCGIGFTMSLYLAALAFAGAPKLEAAARLGVVAGSLVSAAAGLAWLLRRPAEAEAAQGRLR